MPYVAPEYIINVSALPTRARQFINAYNALADTNPNLKLDLKLQSDNTANLIVTLYSDLKSANNRVLSTNINVNTYEDIAFQIYRVIRTNIFANLTINTIGTLYSTNNDFVTSFDWKKYIAYSVNNISTPINTLLG